MPPRETSTRAPAENEKMHLQGFFIQFWKKVPGQNWGKKIDLTAKLGEIIDIEHNQGSKIYHQTKDILDCIMPTIPLKHKCLTLKAPRKNASENKSSAEVVCCK